MISFILDVHGYGVVGDFSLLFSLEQKLEEEGERG